MKPDFRQFSIWQNNSTNFAFYRAYIKISISEGKQIICNVFARTLRNVAICEMCEFYTQTWATLVCDHKLCEECFNSCIDYICPKDHRRTTKDQVLRITLFFNFLLRWKVSIRCHFAYCKDNWCHAMNLKCNGRRLICNNLILD